MAHKSKPGSVETNFFSLIDLVLCIKVQLSPFSEKIILPINRLFFTLGKKFSNIFGDDFQDLQLIFCDFFHTMHRRQVIEIH